MRTISLCAIAVAMVAIGLGVWMASTPVVPSVGQGVHPSDDWTRNLAADCLLRVMPQWPCRSQSASSGPSVMSNLLFWLGIGAMAFRPQGRRSEVSYFSVDGLVSGIKSDMIEAPSKATAAILRNVAVRSKCAATNPKSAVLSAAPSPDAVPMMP